MSSKRQSTALVLAPALIVAVIMGAIIVPWLLMRPNTSKTVEIISALTTTSWLFMLWCALHRGAFQVAALWRTRRDTGSPNAKKPLPRFALYYATCDDFVPDCLRSCLRQDYPDAMFKVVVCDDSRDPATRAELDQVCDGKPGITLVRRDGRVGFKAGNLNHAFATTDGATFEWVVIADADQVLPSDYLRQLAEDVSEVDDDVVFIQSRQMWDDELPPQNSTRFQTAMRPEVLLLLERDIPKRCSDGFFPFLGHGGAIRASAWEKMGGLPNCVSEDLAFTMVAHGCGWRGAPGERSCTWDASPRDFGAFVVRSVKYAAGSAELIMRYFPAYLRSRANFAEKLDLAVWLASYAALPLLLIILTPSAWLSHRVSSAGLALLAPGLAGVFVGMFLISFAPLFSVTPSAWAACRHWFWSFAIYNAALPAAAWSFIVHLAKRPCFQQTPKGPHPSPLHIVTSVLTCSSGLFLVASALIWNSPFSLVISSIGLAQLLFPVFRLLHVEKGAAALLSRVVVWIPGLLFASGVFVMWLYGS